MPRAVAERVVGHMEGAADAAGRTAAYVGSVRLAAKAAEAHMVGDDARCARLAHKSRDLFVPHQTPGESATAMAHHAARDLFGEVLATLRAERPVLLVPLAEKVLPVLAQYPADVVRGFLAATVDDPDTPRDVWMALMEAGIRSGATHDDHPADPDFMAVVEVIAAIGVTCKAAAAWDAALGGATQAGGPADDEGR